MIKIGRVKTMDIVIDNVGLSRNQAEIHKEGEQRLVRDMGSSNGTYVNGGRLSGDHVLQAGDEISMGKFSVFFEKAVGSDRAPTQVRETESAFSSSNPAHGTIFLRADDLEKMQKTAAQKRQAQILWGKPKASAGRTTSGAQVHWSGAPSRTSCAERVATAENSLVGRKTPTSG